MRTGEQKFRVVYETPVQISGVADKGFVGDTETGGRAGRPRANEGIAPLCNDGPRSSDASGGLLNKTGCRG